MVWNTLKTLFVVRPFGITLLFVSQELKQARKAPKRMLNLVICCFALRQGVSPLDAYAVSAWHGGD